MKPIHAALAALLAISYGAGASAQNYPTKPVRLIVPYAAGGGVDILGRIVGAKLTESLGVQVLVDNRAGGGTIIGSEAVANSAGRLHAALHQRGAHGKPRAQREAAVRSGEELCAGRDGCRFVQRAHRASVAAGEDRERDRRARESKAGPAQLRFRRVGSAIHLAMELFASTANIDVVHIPYKGAGPALTDVLGGQVLMMFVTPPPAMPYIKTGRLRPLGVSSPKRLAFLPDVPTIAESGYPGFEVNNWYGLLAPADTPRELVTRLNTTVNALLAMPDVKERIAALGAEPQPGTPDQFAQRVSKEVASWTQVLGKRRGRAQ